MIKSLRKDEQLLKSLIRFRYLKPSFSFSIFSFLYILWPLDLPNCVGPSICWSIRRSIHMSLYISENILSESRPWVYLDRFIWVYLDRNRPCAFCISRRLSLVFFSWRSGTNTKVTRQKDLARILFNLWKIDP